jgi:hypothetical protein
LGWECVLIGLYPISLAFGFIKIEDSAVHAPMWIIALSGIVFLIGGCMILLSQHKRLMDLLAALICLIFAAIGMWVSFYAPPEGFSGGIPFFPSQANIMIGRWIFGGGAVVSFLIFVYALRRAMR